MGSRNMRDLTWQDREALNEAYDDFLESWANSHLCDNTEKEQENDN